MVAIRAIMQKKKGNAAAGSAAGNIMEYLIFATSVIGLVATLVLFFTTLIKLTGIELNMKDPVEKTDLNELEDDIERAVSNAEKLTGVKVDSALDTLVALQTRESSNVSSRFSAMQTAMTDALQAQSDASTRSVDQLQQTTSDLLLQLQQTTGSQISQLQQGMKTQLEQMSMAIANLQQSNGQQIHDLQTGLRGEMETIRRVNQEQLTQIRKTVDEQLQDALDKKLKQSFDSVVEQLGIVQKGLGEMQSLAAGVGDLKKVLANTKTRGILGEAQLGAILEQILAPEQYETNKITVPGSRDPVEFAVKLPGPGAEPVWLPIDSKFPLETYTHLMEAYDTADPGQVEEARKALCDRLMGEAKDIHTKYIHVPETTEFGVLFLPVEGLYAEAVRLGMVEKLQNRFRINLAGPTTMAAFLNSLQMGFRTLAIQKRSAEVWKVLGTVKSEFSKFEDVLNATQKKLNQASEELDKLVGTRTRKINKSLEGITDAAEPAEGEALLPMPEEF